MAGTAEPTQQTVDLERGTLRGRPRRAVRVIVLELFRLLIRLRLAEIQNVPVSGGLLVVANHLHNAVPVFLAPGRRVSSRSGQVGPRRHQTSQCNARGRNRSWYLP